MSRQRSLTDDEVRHLLRWCDTQPARDASAKTLAERANEAFHFPGVVLKVHHIRRCWNIIGILGKARMDARWASIQEIARC